VVHYYTGQDLIKAKFQTYAFEHILTHQVFYKRMGPAERAIYHSKIAAFLKTLLKDGRNQTRRFLIELARHYDLGQQPFEAAKYYYHAAHAIYDTGAYGETIELCWKGIQNARRLDEENRIYDRLRAKLILLLLRASEMRWRGKPELQGSLPLDELITEAEKAATRTGDKSLLTQITFIKGVTYVSTRTLPEALSVLKLALEKARATNDTIQEFSVLSFFGHQTASQNLEKGLNREYQALKIYDERLAGTANGRKKRVLLRLYLRLHAYIGVGEFDRGNYDVAEKELKKCISGFRQMKLIERLVEPLNYISQLYIAMGQFSLAEGALKRSIDIFRNEPGTNPWRAYNRALLGKLYLEWQHVQKAVEPIRRGWKETHVTGNTWLVALVKNYYTELLMHPDYAGRDLDTAEKLLSETIRETTISGFHRSRIWAESQMGQLQLIKQHTSRAVEYSTGAVQSLEKIGPMPALRAEEIYYNHYRVLKAAGQEARAQHFCLAAHKLLREKEASIKKASFRESLIGNVPLSRAIVTSFESEQQAGRFMR
jgi:tetratricopeptide (TPR) repeat protein